MCWCWVVFFTSFTTLDTVLLPHIAYDLSSSMWDACLDNGWTSRTSDSFMNIFFLHSWTHTFTSTCIYRWYTIASSFCCKCLRSRYSYVTLPISWSFAEAMPTIGRISSAHCYHRISSELLSRSSSSRRISACAFTSERLMSGVRRRVNRLHVHVHCCRTIIHMFTCVLSTSKYNMWRLTVFTLVDVHDSSDSATRLPIVGLGFNFLSLFLLHAFHDSDELCTKHLLLERVCVCVCLCSYSSVLGVGSCHTTIRCFPSAFVKINMRITNEE